MSNCNGRKDLYPNEFFKICSAVEVILSIFFYKNHYNAQKTLEKVSVIWYCKLTSPEWWNGRHERLKIFCQRWRKSSSLFSGIISLFVKSGLFCLTIIYLRYDLNYPAKKSFRGRRKSRASFMWVTWISAEPDISAIVRAVFRQLEIALGE